MTFNRTIQVSLQVQPWLIGNHSYPEDDLYRLGWKQFYSRCTVCTDEIPVFSSGSGSTS